MALSVPPCTRTEPWPSAVAELVWSVPCTMVVPVSYTHLADGDGFKRVGGVAAGQVDCAGVNDQVCDVGGMVGIDGAGAVRHLADRQGACLLYTSGPWGRGKAFTAFKSATGHTRSRGPTWIIIPAFPKERISPALRRTGRAASGWALNRSVKERIK